MAEGTSALARKRVVVTRTAEQSQDLCRALRDAGAIPIVAPLISFAPPVDCAPLDAALRALAEFDWLLFTSQNAVRAFVERRRVLALDSWGPAGPPRIAAVGPATAEALSRFGLPVAYIAGSHRGVVLAEELSGQLQQCKILLPRSDRANPDLPEALRRLGAQVNEVVAYRTLPAAAAQEEPRRVVEEDGADAIVLFSPSAVEQMVEVYGGDRLLSMQKRVVFAAIGPVTAAALRRTGIARVHVASDTTVSGILDCLAECWRARVDPQ